MSLDSIEPIIRQIDALEPIPPVIQQVIELSRNPEVPFAQIGALIQHDPALTANLLRTVNSAYFGLTVRVETINTAIKLLGLRQVVELMLLKTVGSHFVKAREGYGLKEGELWKYSVAGAKTAREIAGSVGVSHKERVFTAALLKDIGKIVIDRYVGEAMPAIEKLVQNDGYSFEEAETAILGISHAEIGALVAERWKFTHSLVHLIRRHHLNSEISRTEKEAVVVYAADMVSMMVGIGSGADGMAYRFYDDALRHIGLGESELYGYINAFRGHVEEAEALLEVI